MKQSIFVTCSSSVDYLGPDDGRRFWPLEDDEEPLHNNHVLLWQGFDLTAAGIFEHSYGECPFCRSKDDLLLTEEQDHYEPNRWINFVACGTCGTRGPWGNTESKALLRWNAYAKRRTRETGKVSRRSSP